MTLKELLVAIAVLGVTGALLTPRLTAARSHEGSTWRLPATSSAWCPQSDRSFIGIGAELGEELTPDGYVRILRPLPGGPAEQMGVRANDVILSVDGLSVQYMASEAVVGRIRGPEVGTPVRLHLRRDTGELVETVLLRKHIFPTP
jgi:carboxyl-terminal processing protease